jgi:hypothetical protein
MVIWSESLDRIVPLCQDFEDRLIKLLWRSRPGVAAANTATASASNATSVAGSHCHGAPGGNGSAIGEAEGSVEHSGSLGGHGEAFKSRSAAGGGVLRGLFGEQGRDDADADEAAFGGGRAGDVQMEKVGGGGGGAGRNGSGTFAGQGPKRYKTTWYGKKVALQRSVVGLGEKGLGVGVNESTTTTLDDVEELRGEMKRPVRLFAPLYNGLAAGIALCMLFLSVFLDG